MTSLIRSGELENNLDESVDEGARTPCVSNTSSCNLSPNSVLSDANKFYVKEVLEKLDQMNDKSISICSVISTKPPKLMPKHLIAPNFSNQFGASNLSPFKRKSEAIGNGWNSKGLQLAKTGEWDGAIKAWENALEIRLQVLGKDHPDVANTLNNMGIALGRIHQYSSAMECLHRALQIRTLQYGTTSLDTSATLHNIGNIFQQMKDYESALSCFLEARKAQIVLKESALVARTCNTIGHLYLERQDIPKALESFKEALFYFSRAGFGHGDDEYESLVTNISEAEQELTLSSA
jgi:tetratricopeptide (TPR) repeat protein